MYKIHNNFCESAKLDFIIKSFINRRLLELVNDSIKDGENIEKHKKEDYELIYPLFPKKFPKEQVPYVIKGLVMLLKSRKEFTPDLVMEYFINALIDKNVDFCDSNEISTKRDFSPQQYAIIEFRSEAEILGINANEYTKSLIERIEDIRYYPDFLFLDIDFALLDEFDIEEIKANGKAKIMGIELPDYPENIFLSGSLIDFDKFWESLMSEK